MFPDERGRGRGKRKIEGSRTKAEGPLLEGGVPRLRDRGGSERAERTRYGYGERRVPGGREIEVTNVYRCTQHTPPFRAPLFIEGISLAGCSPAAVRDK